MGSKLQENQTIWRIRSGPENGEVKHRTKMIY
ncbi:hypothetical protein P872_25460 [Rhodonellum psychrophilum GCM71 = DSM 17998]|uniref:Uncharacterized protein n=1 Tax=Rhodonellum psychrophilum GCM71 = DSM 17998 TaxID=1123057 RepID=U5C8I5_9BACT|nr:hypothetical protein P872_25460 [Rhodonellum psychrophilum GCM71 = DSM 17998]